MRTDVGDPLHQYAVESLYLLLNNTVQIPSSHGSTCQVWGYSSQHIMCRSRVMYLRLTSEHCSTHPHSQLHCTRTLIPVKSHPAPASCNTATAALAIPGLILAMMLACYCKGARRVGKKNVTMLLDNDLAKEVVWLQCWVFLRRKAYSRDIGSWIGGWWMDMSWDKLFSGPL